MALLVWMWAEEIKSHLSTLRHSNSNRWRAGSSLMSQDPASHLQNVRPDGGVKPPVNQRYCCQDIERVLLRDVPVNLRSMRRGVPKRTEQTLNKVHQPGMLITLVFGGQGI